MILVRTHARELGGHTHVALFCGSVPDDAASHASRWYTLGRAGELTFRNDEWPLVRAAFAAAGQGRDDFAYVDVPPDHANYSAPR